MFFVGNSVTRLVAGEVGVVGGVDPVVRQRAGHVLADAGVGRLVEDLRGKKKKTWFDTKNAAKKKYSQSVYLIVL